MYCGPSRGCGKCWEEMITCDVVCCEQKNQSQLKQAMDESTKKSNAAERAKLSLEARKQQDVNIVEQLRAVVTEKEAKIKNLEHEVCQLQSLVICQLVLNVELYLFFYMFRSQNWSPLFVNHFKCFSSHKAAVVFSQACRYIPIHSTILYCLIT